MFANYFFKLFENIDCNIPSEQRDCILGSYVIISLNRQEAIGISLLAQVLVTLKMTSGRMYETIVFVWSIYIVQVYSQFYRFVKLLNEDLHFIEDIGIYNSLTGIICLTLCSNVNNCYYAGFDETNRLCYLHDLIATSAKGTGRTYYLKVGDTSGWYFINKNLRVI